MEPLRTFPILPAGHIAAQEANPLQPSGRGTAERLAREAVQGLNARATVSAPVKAATLQQLTAIMAFSCAKAGFITVNSHLYVEQLAGLGWVDLRPLRAEPVKGEEALTESVATLVCNLSHVRRSRSCETAVVY